jgi:hypothetical protein
MRERWATFAKQNMLLLGIYFLKFGDETTGYCYLALAYYMYYSLPFGMVEGKISQKDLYSLQFDHQQTRDSWYALPWLHNSPTAWNA